MKKIDFIIYVNPKDSDKKIPLVFKVNDVLCTCDKATTTEGFTTGDIIDVDFSIYGQIEEVIPSEYDLSDIKYIHYNELYDIDKTVIDRYFSVDYVLYARNNSKFINNSILPIKYEDQTMEV